MTDDPKDDAPVPEPAGPAEVVGTGAPAGGGVPTRRTGRLVRIGLAVLGVIGALSIALGGSTAADPARSVCSQARAILEDDDEDLDAGDIECDDAIVRARDLAAADEDVEELRTESYYRTVGLVFTGIGAVQLIGAIVTLRVGTKRARLIALVAAAFGIVFSPLGPIGIPVLGFVVYAIFFSGDARAVFGDPGGPRMFRPRT